MRTGALAWVVGIQCALLGALMLVAPHQFADSVYTPVQPHLVEWGSLFLLAGASLLGVAALGLTGPVSAAAHLLAGGALLALGISFGLEAAWIGSINYALLGVATALSPLLGGTMLRRDHGQRSLFGLTVGVSALAVGLYLLIARPPVPNEMLLVNGVTFVGSGVLLMLWTVRPVTGVSCA